MPHRTLTDLVPPRRRRPAGSLTDASRWERLPLRSGDVVISTPSKCGTTWTQQLVGMLLLDEPGLDRPISTISPWVDMLVRTEDELFATLGAQDHRRFLKTHTPIDALPWHPELTYVSVARHPLDVALSDLDHMRNQRSDRLEELTRATTGGPEDPGPTTPEEEPPDEAAHLRWFVEHRLVPGEPRPLCLQSLVEHVLTAWEVRHEPNVWILHYTDLWEHLDAEMRLLAAFLDVPIDEDRWPRFVAAGTLDSMRDRAVHAAPEAHLGLWRDDGAFFAAGGTRDWERRLTADDIARFGERLDDLAGEAAAWLQRGWRGTGTTRPTPRPRG